MSYNLNEAMHKKTCDVTSIKLDKCECGDCTNSGGVLVINTNSGEPGDGINCESKAGTECIAISREVFKKTLDFWKTLDNYKPNVLVEDINEFYDKLK